MASARAEAEMVMFDSVQHVLDSCGLVPKQVLTAGTDWHCHLLQGHSLCQPAQFCPFSLYSNQSHAA